MAAPIDAAQLARRDRDERTEQVLHAAATAPSAERAPLLEEVIMLNISLARGLARKFADRGLDADDLEQVALLGLCKAAHGYRPGQGPCFVAYAVPTVLGELRRHFRDHGWLVRPSRIEQELGIALRSVEGELAQTLGHTPDLSELAGRLGCSESEVSRATVAQRGYQGTSLDARVGDGQATLASLIGDPTDEYARVDARLTVQRLMSGLSARNRLILGLRFEQGLTQAEIGQRVGLSQMQISRIISALLAELRKKLDADGHTDEEMAEAERRRAA